MGSEKCCGCLVAAMDQHQLKEDTIESVVFVAKTATQHLLTRCLPM